MRTTGKCLMYFCMVIFFVIAVAFWFVYAANASSRYRADIVFENTHNDNFSVIGKEWMLIDAGKLFYRFDTKETGEYSENILGDLAFHIGNRYAVKIDQIERSGKSPSQYGLSERLAFFEGQRLVVRRYDIEPGVVCVIVQNAEVMRCMAQPH